MQFKVWIDVEAYDETTDQGTLLEPARASAVAVFASQTAARDFARQLQTAGEHLDRAHRSTRARRRATDGPIVHFAARSDAAETPHIGPALCRAGYAARTDKQQYVAGDWAHVTCRNCDRIRETELAREARCPECERSYGPHYRGRCEHGEERAR